MSDAFLRSILANPDDDLPRLVYADFLDEHGDPARAEFIRVQCELAKRADHDPQFRPLEDREHELLSEHEAGWLPDTSGLREWDWRRGFIETVSGAMVAFRNLDSLRRSGHPIRQVHCSGSIGELGDWFTDWCGKEWPTHCTHLSLAGSTAFAPEQLRDFLTRASLPRLAEIDLSNMPTDAEVYDYFWESPLRTQLRALTIGPRTQGDFNSTWLLEAFAQARLERLCIHSYGITNDDLPALIPENWAASLKHLDISDNPIAPDAYLAFEQAHRSLRLDKLDVSGTPLAGISLEPLLHAPSLEALTKLEMNGCGSARRNLEVLAGSPFWTQATELRAHSGTIPASTFEPLARSHGPPALRLLDLADNYLRTDGVRMLCDAPWAGSLTWLALSANYLDDEACEVLAESRRFVNLRTLHLAHNNVRLDHGNGEQITDRGVRALAAHPSLANLRLLSLSNTGITHRGVEVAVNAPHWRLFGLGVAGNNLSPEVVRILADSPRLARFVWLDLADNPRLRGDALRPLAESPYLSRMCELDCGGIDVAPDVQQLFRERLGSRFSH